MAAVFCAKLGVGQLTSGPIIIADMTYWLMQQQKGHRQLADEDV